MIADFNENFDYFDLEGGATSIFPGGPVPNEGDMIMSLFADQRILIV